MLRATRRSKWADHWNTDVKAWPRGSRDDVLVDPEDVIRVIPALDFDEPVVVTAEIGANAFVARRRPVWSS